MYTHQNFVARIQQLRASGMGYHAIAKKVWGLDKSAYAHNVAMGRITGSPLAQERFKLLVDYMDTKVCPCCKRPL